jgi:hypothetical protein
VGPPRHVEFIRFLNSVAEYAPLRPQRGWREGPLTRYSLSMQSNQRVRDALRNAHRAVITVAVLAAATILMLPGTAIADPAKSDVTATIKQNIESRFPGAHVLDVQPSVVPGLYELYMGDQIVYSDAAGDYLVMGPVVDAQTHDNLTEARLNEHGRIKFASLPLDRAIKVVKGNGRRKFAVFSDPDCPFCQQLEKSLLPVTDLTMYVFLFQSHNFIRRPPPRRMRSGVRKTGRRRGGNGCMTRNFRRTAVLVREIQSINCKSWVTTCASTARPLSSSWMAAV